MLPSTTVGPAVHVTLRRRSVIAQAVVIDGIDDTFEDLVAVVVQDGIGRHQVTDVANEHKAPARQRRTGSPSTGPVYSAIRAQAPRQSLATLRESRLERSLHEAEPVAIDVDLVHGIDRCDRVFTILDRGNRRFQHYVGDVCGGLPADRVVRVRPDLDMQPVVREQVGHGIAVP